MKKIDVFSMQIVSLYFDDEKDFSNVIQVCKKYALLLDRFRTNPIRITRKNTHLFPYIQTQQVFTPLDFLIENIQRKWILYPVTYEQFITNNDSNVIYKKVKFTRNDAKLIKYIPKTVSVIGIEGMRDINSLDVFNIPTRVTQLEKSACMFCDYSFVEIPPTLVSIERSAFSNCSKLTEVVLPNNFSFISEKLFYSCTMLQKINFPSDLRFIGESAFCRTKLPKITISPNYVLQGSIFMECFNLLQITFCGQLVIPQHICEGCSCLKQVMFDDSIEYFLDFCFSGCCNLEDFVVPKHLKLIGNFSFKNCCSLRHLTFPKTLNNVGAFAFSNCSKLEDLIFLNEKVVLYGVGNFEKCASLTNIQIPTCFTNYKKVFKYPVTVSDEVILRKFHLSGLEKHSQKDDDFFNKSKRYLDYNGIANLEFSNPNYYKTADLGTSLDIIESGYYSFECLSSLFIPSTVVLNGTNAVCCLGSRNVIFPKYAFLMSPQPICPIQLTQIVFPSNFTKLESQMIKGYDLTSFQIPTSVVEVEKNAFYFMHLLSSITIPNSVTKLSERFVCGCTRLKTIVVENGLKSLNLDVKKVIEQNKVQQPWSKNGLYIPQEETTTLDTFINFSDSLTKLIIPNSIRKIGNNTFKSLTNLKEIVLPESLNEIGTHIFPEDGNLTKIDVKNNNMDKFVVSYNFSLKMKEFGYKFNNVEFLNTEKEIFGNCVNIKKVKIFEDATYFKDKLFNTIPHFLLTYSQLNLSITSILFPTEISCLISNSFSNSNIIFIDISHINLIPEMSFTNCVCLTKVVLSTQLTFIGSKAFQNCVSLKELLLPNLLVEVCESAFENCCCLESVKCDSKHVIYGKKCFSKCFSLTGVPLYSTLSVGMFMECFYLSKIELCEGITKIPDCTFFKCFSLSVISIPKSVTHIGVFAFRKCYSLKEVEFGETLCCVDDSAFMDCTNLEKAVFKNKNILLKSDLFEGCISLKNLEIGGTIVNYKTEVSFMFSEQMKKIGIQCENIVLKRTDVLKFGTFNMVNELKRNSFIRRIDEGCFYLNNELSAITILSNISTLGNYTFYGCNYLTQIYITKYTFIPNLCFLDCK
ncbi:hypothetical protein EIN_055490 [Entamoeba invadens IP1]|uniref:hypothetical protein n=1 Tax=Entamoeba invadens IP1 TaxID=370355 RepID=UPI0002C3DAA1|nr:hypothetical protein EIN_055490 [Entamoeba invadens IP1]ELP93224.1 hypothetical protein EIN_055490 [Entamoeba invadens IP1]|eukprot:XP_004259995.1 hypothetical protein EIN_055490 [Entamoeba invadens IP1]